MQIMQDLLKTRGYKTIFFKSWEYANEEKPWIPFMITIVNELFGNKIARKELIKNVFLFSTDVVLQKYTQKYSLGEISTGGILDVINKSRIGAPFREWSDKDTNIVIERVTKLHDFKNAIADEAGKSPHGKIIIFIDDLDRISDKVVDFLNSLKTFLDIKGCIFILGCDRKILDSALITRYKEKMIYTDYFDKIVQTEFYMPQISEQAIKNYLSHLTGWTDPEIKQCTHLVDHSIGSNPRKIKRVMNATLLIKSVFEKRVATFLQAFQRPKLRTGIKGGEGEGKKEEELIALKSEIARIFTPTEVFNLLFDKKVLFKLVCMREQWPKLYEHILSDEDRQYTLVFLQDASNGSDIQKYTRELLTLSTKELDTIKEEIIGTEEIYYFLSGYPKFEGVEDLKTYLTLLGISSPEADVSLDYAKPEELPLRFFNRYMIFERITKGQVSEEIKEIIEKRIDPLDWNIDLDTFVLFSEVMRAFGYDDLLKSFFADEENLAKIAKKNKRK